MIPATHKARREEELHQHKVGREYMKFASDEQRKDEIHDVKLAEAMMKLHHGHTKNKMQLAELAEKSESKEAKGYSQGSYGVQGYHHGGIAERKVLGDLDARIAQHPPVPQGYACGTCGAHHAKGYCGGTMGAKGYESGAHMVVPTHGEVPNITMTSGFSKGVPEAHTEIPMGVMNWGFAGGVPGIPPQHPAMAMAHTMPTNPEAGPSDTVPAMLTPGEAVIPREAAQHPKYKGKIKEMINHGREMQDKKKHNKGTGSVGYSEGVYNVPGYEGGVDFVDPMGGVYSTQADVFPVNAPPPIAAQTNRAAQYTAATENIPKVEAVPGFNRFGNVAPVVPAASYAPPPVQAMKSAVIDSPVEEQIRAQQERAKQNIPVSPAPVTPDAMGYISTLESNNNPAAKSPINPATGNPYSTARGLGGFTDARLNEVLSTGGILNKEGKPATAVDYDTDPTVQRAVLKRSNELYASSLNKQGLQPSHQNLYAMHHFGAGDGPKFLAASADTPTNKIFSEKVLAANPYLQNKTKGDVVANWDARYMQSSMGGRPVPPTTIPNVPQAIPAPGVDVVASTPDVPPVYQQPAPPHVDALDNYLETNKSRIDSMDAKDPVTMEKLLKQASQGAESAYKGFNEAMGFEGKDFARMAILALGSKALGYNNTQAMRYAMNTTMKQADARAAAKATHETELAKTRLQGQNAFNTAMATRGANQAEKSVEDHIKDIQAKDKAGVLSPGVAQQMISAVRRGRSSEYDALVSDSRNFSPVGLQAYNLGIDMSKDPEKMVYTDPTTKVATGSMAEMYRGRDGKYYRRTERGLEPVQDYANYRMFSAAHDDPAGQRNMAAQAISKDYFQPQRDTTGKVIGAATFTGVTHDDAVNAVATYARKNNLNAGELATHMQPLIEIAKKSGDKAPDFSAYLEMAHLGGDKLVDQRRLMVDGSEKDGKFKMLDSNHVRKVNDVLKSVSTTDQGRADFLSKVDKIYDEKLPKSAYADSDNLARITGKPKDSAVVKQLQNDIKDAPNSFVANLIYQSILWNNRSKK